MTTVATRRKTTELTAVERREEAFQLVDDIKESIAGGKTFTNPWASGLFLSLRNNLTHYGPNTFVSPDQLKGLRKIQKRMRGKRK